MNKCQIAYNLLKAQAMSEALGQVTPLDILKSGQDIECEDGSLIKMVDGKVQILEKAKAPSIGKTPSGKDVPKMHPDSAWERPDTHFKDWSQEDHAHAGMLHLNEAEKHHEAMTHDDRDNHMQEALSHLSRLKSGTDVWGDDPHREQTARYFRLLDKFYN